MPSRLLAGLAVVAVLSGCAAPQRGPAAPTRTVVDIEGTSVQVPVTPQRVVVLSEPTLDGALALGVRPVGATSGRGQAGLPGYLADVSDGIPVLGTVAQPNFEAIGKAKPDLILVDGSSINNNPPVIDLLRKIAPTAYVGHAGGDWRTTFTHLSDALNKVEEGRKVLADYDRSVADASTAVGDRSGETFSIVRWQGSSAALILKELPPGVALTDLKLRRPPAQDRIGRGHSEPVSLENIEDVDADWMFFGTLGGSSVGNPGAGGTSDVDGARAALEQARAVPGFADLAANRKNQVVLVDGSLWTSTGGPLLMNRIVNDVRKALGA
ncbi:ABC transporter substrate-binding protein [Lentzea sp. NPDC058436]|uniref:ABC transporter substrate-binding protein n=1 Tax=Lentzea sp. NPDC058436 TaxID=3346499 RepID=UPI0036491BFD